MSRRRKGAPGAQLTVTRDGRVVTCSRCKGHGEIPLALGGAQLCMTCGGEGQVTLPPRRTP